MRKLGRVSMAFKILDGVFLDGRLAGGTRASPSWIG